jgi:hypothetical protein
VSIALTIAGVAMSNYLVKTLTIEADEGCAVVAQFSVCDAAKMLDHEDLAGGAVVISWSGTLLFTGRLREATFDPFMRVFDCKATDLREDAKDYGPEWLEGDLFQAAITGTLDFSTGNKKKVYGTGTYFNSELRPGQRIFNATNDPVGAKPSGTATANGAPFSGIAALTDSSASWVQDSLAGKYAYNTSHAGWSGRIVSNTATVAYVSVIEGNGWSVGDGYRISPGLNRATAIASIESDTELTLEFEYPGTCGTGKTGKRLWGLYFEPLSGSATDTLDKAIKALDAEWATLEVDKSGNFRISDCRAKATADLVLGPADFVFHSVTMVHHDPQQVVNLVSYDVTEDYQLRWTYLAVNRVANADEEADSIVSQLRSGASGVGEWKLKTPTAAGLLGAGPPYTFDVIHEATWEQQRRTFLCRQGFKNTASIAKYGLKPLEQKIALDHGAVSGAKTWGYSDTNYTAPLRYLTVQCRNNHKEPEGFTIKSMLAGLARAKMLESHRLITVPMQMAMYANASRDLTIEGSFPNLRFRGKTTRYRHEYDADTGRAVTTMEVAVMPPLT